MKSYKLKRQSITQITNNKFKTLLIIEEQNSKNKILIKVEKETETIDEAICFVENTLNKHGLLSLWV